MIGDAMDRRDCLRLLARSNVGRVAFSARALPTMRPLTYTLVGAVVVLRATAQSLARQLDGQVVAFEVDEIDPVHATGWSILVTGTARRLPSAGPTEHAVAITSAAISGCWLPAVVGSTSELDRDPPGKSRSLTGSRAHGELTVELGSPRRKVG